MRVFVTGGTGLICTRLTQRLQERGNEVVVLTRRPGVARERLSSCTVIEGNPTQPDGWARAVDACDGAINLAGENLFARRWTEEFKARLRDSRLRSTEHVARALANLPRTAEGKPKVLVSASAVG